MGQKTGHGKHVACTFHFADDMIDVIDRAGRLIPVDTWPVHVPIKPPHRRPPRARRRWQGLETTTAPYRGQIAIESLQ